MKIKLPSMVLLLALAADPASAQVDLTQGLVAHYPFTGDAADSSGQGNDGVVTGATLTTDANGLADRAYYFNGISDHIDVPASPALDVTVYSVAAVVKPMGFNAGLCQGNVIFWKGPDAAPGHYGLIFSDNPYDADCNTLDTEHQNFYDDHSFSLSTSDTPHVQLDQWYCVLSTFDGDSLRLYVDGLIRFTGGVGAFGTNGSGLSIGHNAFNPSYPYWLHGVIDDLRIYDRVLNDQEIEALCGSGITSITEQRSSTWGALVAPNPLHGSGRLILDRALPASATIELIGMDGRVLRSWKGSGNTIVELNVSGVSPGYYGLRIVGPSMGGTIVRLCVQ